MKALEILEAITENEGTHLWLDDGSGYPKSYINEAIQELEALKNRSCENCKYARDSNLLGEISHGEKFCNELVRFFHNGFCCNNWKTKND